MSKSNLVNIVKNDFLIIKNKNFCYFYIINTKNNWKILFTNSKGNIIVEFSAKSLYSSKRDRISKESLDTLLRFFFNKYKDLITNFQKVVKNCIIRLLGSKSLSYLNTIKSVTFHVKSYKWQILGIENCTPQTFNGCRFRKKRR